MFQETADLSALVDMNDQIEEDHLALERQLRQDLDLAGTLDALTINRK